MAIPTAPHRVAETLQERIRALEIDFRLAYWDSQVRATPANDARRAAAEIKLRAAKGDRAALRVVEAALGADLHDPLLHRMLEVLRLSLTANQMADDLRSRIVQLATAVESEFASFRPRLDGRAVTDNDLREILRTSDDEGLRRRAWEASKEIGARVAGRVRELARLRNQAAHDLGYPDHYRRALSLQEIEEEWLFGLLGELEAATEAPFRALVESLEERVAAHSGRSRLMPWDCADPFFQDLPPEVSVNLDPLLAGRPTEELVAATYAAWGMDLSAVLANSDLYPRPLKSQHAFCLDVDRTGRDVRILANIVPGEHWMEVMLHECGHAAYDIGIDPALPYLLHRPAHTFVTEAVATLGEWLLVDPRWLCDVVGAPVREVAALDAPLRVRAAAQDLVTARWVCVMAHFERALYGDPECDLDGLWWELVERFQLVSAPPGRDAPDWAAKVHICTAPVYYHNYLLGAVLASQVQAALTADCGEVVGNPEVGRWLRERIFRPGNALRWDALVEQATGAPLSVDPFVSKVRDAPGSAWQ